MQAKFGIERERHNKLYYKEYNNDKGAFHFHSQIELYFVDDGEMEVFVNNQRKILKKGEMSVSLSYDAHAYRTVNYSKSSVLIIPPYICEDFISAIKHKRVVNPFICDSDTVKQIKACFNEIKKGNINEIKLLGYVYVILGIIMESICFETTEEVIEPELSSKILFYINENYKNNITLESIASNFGYSQNYISRYFKACFDIGINQYINIIRLKNALMLMHEKKYSITYCALESGFNSMRTFYRVFYNQFQCAPRDYFKNN